LVVLRSVSILQYIIIKNGFVGLFDFVVWNDSYLSTRTVFPDCLRADVDEGKVQFASTERIFFHSSDVVSKKAPSEMGNSADQNFLLIFLIHKSIIHLCI
jgi:hypothetical protein